MITNQMSNFSSLVVKAAAANPDLVYLAGLADQGGAIFIEVRAAGYMATLLGPDGLANPPL
jgi:ABC-type branched-subunit amino acid transport system substrate-binding protein